MTLYLKTKKKRVNNYISDKDCSPLHFNLTEAVAKRLLDERVQDSSLDEKVFWALHRCKQFSSINKLGNTETRADKWRSSLDIWRHVIYRNPEITIFDVMTSLYDQQGKLLSLCCNAINRRVFRTGIGEDFRVGAYGFKDKNIEDEYMLEFISWKNINRKLTKRRTVKKEVVARKKYD